MMLMGFGVGFLHFSRISYDVDGFWSGFSTFF